MKHQWWKHYQTIPETQSIDEPLPETKRQFEIGDLVRLREKPERVRRVVDIRWHRYRHEFVYYVEVSGDGWRVYWFADQLVAETKDKKRVKYLLKVYMSKSIDFRKQVYSLKLLFKNGARGRQVIEKYRHLWCPECGKVDEDRAVAEGIAAPPNKVPVAPALSTGDYFVLMNLEGKAAFQEIFGEAISFQEIENPTPLFLAQPKKIVRVQEGQRVYAVGEPSQGDFLQPRSPMQPLRHPNEPEDIKPSRGATCSSCGRFYEVTVRPDLYNFEPDEILVGLQAESGWGSLLMWVVAPAQAAQLKAAKIPSVRVLDYVPIPPQLR